MTKQWPKTLHRKLKNEKHEPHLNLGVNSGAPEVQAILVPRVTPVVLLLLLVSCH